MTSISNYICPECGKPLSVDVLAFVYCCSACAAKYPIDRWKDKLKAGGGYITEKEGGIEEMTTKIGTCKVCDRVGVSITGHDSCGACYPTVCEFLSEYGDVDKAIESARAWRASRPVKTHRKNMTPKAPATSKSIGTKAPEKKPEKAATLPAAAKTRGTETPEELYLRQLVVERNELNMLIGRILLRREKNAHPLNVTHLE